MYSRPTIRAPNPHRAARNVSTHVPPGAAEWPDEDSDVDPDYVPGMSDESESGTDTDMDSDISETDCLD